MKNPIVFTNGCFDILHVGHLRLLRHCASLGVVVVGLNGDESVRELKGPSRPVNSEADRREMLMALPEVSRVLVFDEARCTALIRRIQPDIYVKGGDYTLETLDPGERQALEDCGARIEFFKTVEGKSTTAVLEKAKEAENAPDDAFTYYMHDNHTFSRLRGPVNEIVAMAREMASGSPDGMLCSLSLKRNREVVRYVGCAVHAKGAVLGDTTEWEKAVRADPDAMRLLEGGKNKPISTCYPSIPKPVQFAVGVIENGKMTTKLVTVPSAIVEDMP